MCVCVTCRFTYSSIFLCSSRAAPSLQGFETSEAQCRLFSQVPIHTHTHTQKATTQFFSPLIPNLPQKQSGLYATILLERCQGQDHCAVCFLNNQELPASYCLHCGNIKYHRSRAFCASRLFQLKAPVGFISQ